jgi:hypothetical protein
MGRGKGAKSDARIPLKWIEGKPLLKGGVRENRELLKPFLLTPHC